jgi:hypothetical protein
VLVPVVGEPDAVELLVVKAVRCHERLGVGHAHLPVRVADRQRQREVVRERRRGRAHELEAGKGGVVHGDCDVANEAECVNEDDDERDDGEDGEEKDAPPELPPAVAAAAVIAAVVEGPHDQVLNSGVISMLERRECACEGKGPRCPSFLPYYARCCCCLVECNAWLNIYRDYIPGG